jgi:hypothetical protein
LVSPAPGMESYRKQLTFVACFSPGSYRGGNFELVESRHGELK